ncbi:type VI secretion system protein TssA [Enterobacter asburiae]|uniref:type VI secretion system protein TssA n=1 Tax=Enterobacter asburiae TaxID=61645 RepID=UPI002FF470D5
MAFRHPWSQQVLAGLPDELTGAAVCADDPLWERVETELVKLGSLAHSEVDLQAVMRDCLMLLESRTKDMRVLVQLVRCLQYPATASSWEVALVLLDDWLSAFWRRAWPLSPGQKQRLMVQMVRRFEGAQARLCEQATAPELDNVQLLLQGLVQTWTALSPDHGDLFDGLLTALQRAGQLRQEHPLQETSPSTTPPEPSAPAATVTPTAVESAPRTVYAVPQMDTSDERTWQQTLLKVAGHLVEQQPGTAMGYRLRRHALWNTITSAPVISRENRTPLAAVSPDRVSEYESSLARAELSLWGQIEQSLTLSPYWFDGHWLSAQVAVQLGYADVAEAIAGELRAFLARLPVLATLAFSDGTPFLSPRCQAWLGSAQAVQTSAETTTDLTGALRTCCEEKGLNAALALLDARLQAQSEPRERFYSGLMLAELLEAEGMSQLAMTHYQQLHREAQRLALAQWEPGLVARLERRVQAHG